MPPELPSSSTGQNLNRCSQKVGKKLAKYSTKNQPNFRKNWQNSKTYLEQVPSRLDFKMLAETLTLKSKYGFALFLRVTKN